MLHKDKKIKIGLIGDSFAGGGAEKIHALLSIYFKKKGLDVHNCIFSDKVFYEFDGSLLNLGKIKPNSSSFLRKRARLFRFYSFVKQNDFDAIIDFRMRPSFLFEFMVSKCIYPKNTYYYVLSGVLSFYFPKSNFLSKIIYKNRKITTVSDAIEKAIIKKGYANQVRNMFQPFDFSAINIMKNDFNSENNYILAVGSMNSDIKQFDKLITTYSKSILPQKNIKLLFLGDGHLKDNYIQLTKALNISHLVSFKGIVQNPFPYYKNAIFTVLCSKNEGLSNAIVESLACETPVVSFDCFSGPREIIINHYNGILVEDQQFERLVEAMNLMMTDTNLYQTCKQNAVRSIEKFSIEIIGSQWLDHMFNNN